MKIQQFCLFGDILQLVKTVSRDLAIVLNEFLTFHKYEICYEKLKKDGLIEDVKNDFCIATA